MRKATAGEMDFVVFVVFGQFVAHVAGRKDVNARRDERDHHEHGDGETVDVVIDVDHQAADGGEVVELSGEGVGVGRVGGGVAVGVVVIAVRMGVGNCSVR